MLAFRMQAGSSATHGLMGAWEAAAAAAGATCTMQRHMQPGVNCALFALGPFIGFSATQSVNGVSGASGASGASPGFENHILAAETLLKALSGEGEGQVHFPFWKTCLHRLGFSSASQAAARPGDIVVYTVCPCPGPPADTPPSERLWRATREELACHYGVVRRAGAGEEPPIWVESKAGAQGDQPTFLHPLDVIDPSYYMLSRALGVHLFRPPAQPAPGAGGSAPEDLRARTPLLYRVACWLEPRMEAWLAAERGGRAASVAEVEAAVERAEQQEGGPRRQLLGRCVRFESPKFKTNVGSSCR